MGQVPWAARVGHRGRPDPQLEVIRNPHQLFRAFDLNGDSKSRHQIEKFLSDAFQINAVNFKRQMLLVVGSGVQSAGGDDVVVTMAAFDKGRNALVVHWALRPRASPQPAVGSSVEPATLVLLERFDGDVILEPTPDP